MRNHLSNTWKEQDWNARKKDKPGRNIGIDLPEWAQYAHILCSLYIFSKRYPAKKPLNLKDKNTHSTMSISLCSGWHGWLMYRMVTAARMTAAYSYKHMDLLSPRRHAYYQFYVPEYSATRVNSAHQLKEHFLESDQLGSWRQIHCTVSVLSWNLFSKDKFTLQIQSCIYLWQFSLLSC